MAAIVGTARSTASAASPSRPATTAGSRAAGGRGGTVEAVAGGAVVGGVGSVGGRVRVLGDRHRRRGVRRPLPRLLDEHRREHAHRGEQLVGGDRLEPPRQRAQPARGEPRAEHLVDLLADVAAERVERLALAVARERVQPHHAGAFGSASSSQSSSSRRVGAVERVVRRRAERRVLRREVAVLREQRRRLGVVHREPGVALAGLDARRPQQQRGLARRTARRGPRR